MAYEHRALYATRERRRGPDPRRPGDGGRRGRPLAQGPPGLPRRPEPRRDVLGQRLEPRAARPSLARPLRRRPPARRGAACSATAPPRPRSRARCRPCARRSSTRYLAGDAERRPHAHHPHADRPRARPLGPVPPALRRHAAVLRARFRHVPAGLGPHHGERPGQARRQRAADRLDVVPLQQRDRPRRRPAVPRRRPQGCRRRQAAERLRLLAGGCHRAGRAGAEPAAAADPARARSRP